MMKRNIILIFIFFATSSVAQLSGYLGKRFVVGYSNYFMVGFRGPGYNSSTPNDEYSQTLNNTHCLNFEYVQKQRLNICLSAQYLRTGIAYDRGHEIGLFADANNVNPFCYPGQTKYEGNFSVPAKLSSVNFGLGFKLFHKGYIAPVGRYQKFELLVLFETVKFDNTHFYTISPNSNYYPDVLADVGVGQYKYKSLVFTYTMGRQRILFDRIVLDYGLRFGFEPTGFIPFVFRDSVADRKTMESQFRFESSRRIFRQQLINLHIGIGFLAF